MEEERVHYYCREACNVKTLDDLDFYKKPNLEPFESAIQSGDITMPRLIADMREGQWMIEEKSSGFFVDQWKNRIRPERYCEISRADFEIALFAIYDQLNKEGFFRWDFDTFGIADYYYRHFTSTSGSIFNYWYCKYIYSHNNGVDRFNYKYETYCGLTGLENAIVEAAIKASLDEDQSKILLFDMRRGIEKYDYSSAQNALLESARNNLRQKYNGKVIELIREIVNGREYLFSRTGWYMSSVKDRPPQIENRDYSCVTSLFSDEDK